MTSPESRFTEHRRAAIAILYDTPLLDHHDGSTFRAYKFLTGVEIKKDLILFGKKIVYLFNVHETPSLRYQWSHPLQWLTFMLSSSALAHPELDHNQHIERNRPSPQGLQRKRS